MATFLQQPDEAASKDTYLNNNNPDTNYGNEAQLRVGRYDAANYYRTILQFDFSSIQPATVSSASVSLYVAYEYLDAATVFNLYRVTTTWTEAGATWNNMVGNYNATVLATRTIPDPASVNSIQTFTFNSTGLAVIEGMLNGTYTNYGWYIMSADETIQHAVMFHSAGVATSTYRPKMTFEYTLIPTGGAGVIVIGR